MKGNKLTVALDVDGVLQDCHSYVHKIAESICGRDLPVLPHFDFQKSFDLTDDEWQRTRTIIERGFPADEMLFYPGAVEFVHTLAERYDVFFLTSHWRGCNRWVPGRERRLNDAFPGLDVVFAHAKGRGDYDVLLDDKPSNVEAANAKPFSCGVLFTRPWNANWYWPTRVSSYDEFIQFMKDCEHTG